MPADTISIISAAFVTIATAVVGYLKGKDAMEFKRINTELEAARLARDEMRRDREEDRQELAKCHELHLESDRRATRMEVELSFLKQQIQPRP